METTALDLGFVEALGLAERNAGTSTGAEWMETGAEWLESRSPVDGRLIGAAQATDRDAYDAVIAKAQSAFVEWRSWPAPRRGEVVRKIGEALRREKENLGKLVSYEMGKSLQEGYGEVQEMIDICDFAVGLVAPALRAERCTRSVRVIACMSSGIRSASIGIISGLQLPGGGLGVELGMLAWVCGDVCVWKPSEKTPLTAVAMPADHPGRLCRGMGDGRRQLPDQRRLPTSANG